MVKQIDYLMARLVTMLFGSPVANIVNQTLILKVYMRITSHKLKFSHETHALGIADLEALNLIRIYTAHDEQNDAQIDREVG